MKKRVLFIFFYIVQGYILCGQEIRSDLLKAQEHYTKGVYSEVNRLCEKWLGTQPNSLTLSDSIYYSIFELAGKGYLASGKYNKALQLFLELKNYDSINLGINHPRYASDLNSLADCYFRMGEYKTALPLFEKARDTRLKLLGSSHPDFASSLENLAMLHNDMGNYGAALPKLDEAVRIRKSNQGLMHPDYATTIDNLATVYYSLGNLDTAFLLLEEAKQIRLTTLGVEHPDYAKSLNNLAALHYVKGNYSAALPLYLEACRTDSAALGCFHPDYASDLTNLANLYKKTGNYKAALPLLAEAGTIYKAALGTGHPSYATALFNLAGLHNLTGDYESAMPLYLEAKNLRLSALGNQHPDYARALNNLAILYVKTGNYEAALPLYMETVSINRNALGANHPDYAMSLNNLATLHRRMGNAEAALSLFREAIKIRRETIGPMHPSYASSLNNLALVYCDIGNYEKAIPLLEEAAQIDKQSLGPGHPDYATDLINLSSLYIYFGNDSVASDLLDKALNIYKDKFGTRSHGYAITLTTLGRLYQSMKKHDDALSAYTESLNILEEFAGDYHPDVAMVKKSIALLHSENGNFRDALPLLTDASAIYKSVMGIYYPEYALSLQSLAGIHQASGNSSSAVPMMMEANSIINHNLRDNYSFLTEDEKKKYYAKVGGFYPSFLSFLQDEQEPDGRLIESGYNNELLLKGLILSSVAALQRDILERHDSTLVRKYEQMRMMKRQINSMHQKPVTRRDKEPDATEENCAQIEQELMQQSESFSRLKASMQIRWQDVRKHLRADEAAIEFVRFRNRVIGSQSDSALYAAFVVRIIDSIPQFVVLFEENDLEKALPGKSATFKELNERYQDSLFYNLVWKPLDPFLFGIRKVYYASAGLLNNLSMAAIKCPDQKVLMEKYRLEQLSSTRVIASCGKNTPVTDAVVFGGIDYDADSLTLSLQAAKYQKDSGKWIRGNRSLQESSRGGFRYLPGSLKEAEGIKVRLEKRNIPVMLCAESEAVEESFAALSGNHAPSLIHLATHGFYYPSASLMTDQTQAITYGGAETFFKTAEDPLFRSGLLMAGANLTWKGATLPDKAEDGILTAREVSTMNLLKTQLVVLSACQTGQGDVNGTEGVEGLQRGFKMAGARYIIMSLWDVPDKETTEFMFNFYDNWLGGMEIREAFHATQTTMKSKYAGNPYKWAAFTLVE